MPGVQGAGSQFLLLAGDPAGLHGLHELQHLRRAFAPGAKDERKTGPELFTSITVTD